MQFQATYSLSMAAPSHGAHTIRSLSLYLLTKLNTSQQCTWPRRQTWLHKFLLNSFPHSPLQPLCSTTTKPHLCLQPQTTTMLIPSISIFSIISSGTYEIEDQLLHSHPWTLSHLQGCDGNHRFGGSTPVWGPSCQPQRSEPTLWWISFDLGMCLRHSHNNFWDTLPLLGHSIVLPHFHLVSGSM
jgi:hypothetical protein